MARAMYVGFFRGRVLIPMPGKGTNSRKIPQMPNSISARPRMTTLELAGTGIGRPGDTIGRALSVAGECCPPHPDRVSGVTHGATAEGRWFWLIRKPPGCAERG